MQSRRDVTQLILGTAAALSFGGTVPALASAALGRTLRIVGAARRDETTQYFDFYSAAFQPTWTSNDVQFTSVADGFDRAIPPKFTFHSRVYKFIGDPSNLIIEDLPNYPPTPWTKAGKEAEFWAGSCLAIDGKIYQLLSTSNHAYLQADGSFWSGFRMIGSKIIFSADNGHTWRNQDGSPARWEHWDERSSRNMLFFASDASEPDLGGSFLQMGQDYRLNKDGFVYLYTDNRSARGSADEVVLLRAPRDKIMDRSAYEFFRGHTPDGGASWTKDLDKRGVIHRFPPGWTIDGRVLGQPPAGWSMSVVYNAPLAAYMLVAQGIGVSESGGWFGKPSYLGIWVSSTPWGPFRQVHEETAWTPGGEMQSRAILPRVAPKWIAADGKSFWLMWGEVRFQGREGETEHPDKSFMEISRDIINDDAKLARTTYAWSQAHQSYTKLNVQRVDLIVA